jgi:hypothetical protein
MSEIIETIKERTSGVEFRVRTELLPSSPQEISEILLDNSSTSA